jgi:sigma-E factor negative regulatory protein RseC
MHENIEHPGIIQKIENGRVWVNISQQSACGSCQSKSLCGMAEVADKTVEVNATGRTLAPGQQVTITLKKTSGYKALMLGYLIPFLLLMTTLIVSLTLTGNEALSALLAIFIIIPWYSMLYAKRDSIKAAFRFYIK